MKKNQISSYHKQAQIWAVDMLFLLLLFGTILFLFPSWFSHISSPIQMLTEEGTLLGDLLLSQGIPQDWNLSTVILPGILNSNGHLNSTKLFLFTQLSEDQFHAYPITHDYAFWFTDQQGKNVSFFGRTLFGSTNATSFFFDASSLIAMQRIVFFNGSLLRMNLVIWEE